MKLASREDMKRIIDHVRGNVVLHNYLLNDHTDNAWFDDSIVEEGLDDLEPEPMTATNAPDYARRQELFFYLSELEDTTIN
jgi:hypothetical protein